MSRINILKNKTKYNAFTYARQVIYHHFEVTQSIIMLLM